MFYAVYGLNILATLFNAILSVYITNNKQCRKYDNLLVYFAFIISISAIIVDIIYCALY